LPVKGKQMGITTIEKPIIRTKFKRLQETGMEAENYFILHFDKEEKFQGGLLTDARLYGDGYDFQVDVQDHSYLAEVKGIRKSKGRIRLTAREYEKAKEFKSDFILSLVTNLGDILAGQAPGRTTPAQKVFFGPTGLGIEDISLAAHIYSQALARGCGTVLSLWSNQPWI